MTPRAFGALAEGELARWSHRISDSDVDGFAELSGDDNPLHLDDEFARRHGFRSRVAHGMLLGAWLSRVLGTILPGPGVLWLSQDTTWLQPAYVGDLIEIEVRVTHRSPALRTLVLQTTIRNDREETLMTGEAKTMMLAEPAKVPWSEMVAVVTGASRGIGAAVARGLGARGAKVVVNYHSSAGAAQEVVDAVIAAGGQAVAVQADMETEAGGRGLCDAALEAFGRVDVVVNNATPPIERKPFEELSWAEVDRYWRAYVQSAFVLAQAALPGMKERGFGRFVHLLTSAAVGKPPANVAGYVAAKSALWGLTRSMAVELAPHGITVNAVSPSAVMTDQWSGEPERRRRALALSIPAQRLAGPDEVAATVLFLIGEEGGYVTGANLPVAGGEVM
jgi:3-oxoacyl-[acyl-carrier protein] reductase